MGPILEGPEAEPAAPALSTATAVNWGQGKVRSAGGLRMSPPPTPHLQLVEGVSRTHAPSVALPPGPQHLPFLSQCPRQAEESPAQPKPPALGSCQSTPRSSSIPSTPAATPLTVLDPGQQPLQRDAVYVELTPEKAPIHKGADAALGPAGQGP